MCERFDRIYRYLVVAMLVALMGVLVYVDFTTKKDIIQSSDSEQHKEISEHMASVDP